ncbi:hypothetical protein LSG31_11210 [Fodinisporobacter ferrooxydans]|uniref:Uncharacterized protein n=1 Tax=Fodinisporobacter ferrooxydans TaxID=2901836 RepID=A0ABY4CQD3_9BACL|nr:hypothetical protein LSG31_11210 [Alicyclobacillaceae bacterium MYW30-H2]
MGGAAWTLSRVLVLFTAFAFFMIAIQVTMYHYRENFRHWSMYIPVITLPVLGVAGLLASFLNTPFLHAVDTVLLWLEAFGGLFGVYMHARGVGVRVGGYEMRNFLTGPPVVLPFMIFAISILGLLAEYWG